MAAFRSSQAWDGGPWKRNGSHLDEASVLSLDTQLGRFGQGLSLPPGKAGFSGVDEHEARATAAVTEANISKLRQAAPPSSKIKNQTHLFLLKKTCAIPLVRPL